MPAFSGPSNGNFPSVSAVPLRFQTITFGGAGSSPTLPLFADGMPGLRAWFLQTSGAGNVSIQIQFADGNTLGGTPDWQPLVLPFAILLNVPSLTSYGLGSRQFRAQLTATGAAVVRCRLSGSLT